jgi:hypothetical protein
VSTVEVALAELARTLRLEILDEVRATVRAELAARDSAPRLVSAQDYAIQHGISTRTVRARIADGSLTAQRIGRRVLVEATATIGEPVRRADAAASPAARAERLLARRGGAR